MKRSRFAACRNNNGSMHILFTGALVCAALMGLGTLSAFHLWYGKVKSQQQLNQCLGKITLAFRNWMNHIEKGNAQMKVTRSAIAATTLDPAARPPLEAALKLQDAFQRIQWNKWNIQRGVWAVSGCPGIGNRVPPPNPWVFDPPDFLGPRPLRFTSEPNTVFQLEVKYDGRVARTETWKEGTWQSEWPGAR